MCIRLDDFVREAQTKCYVSTILFLTGCCITVALHFNKKKKLIISMCVSTRTAYIRYGKHSTKYIQTLCGYI